MNVLLALRFSISHLSVCTLELLPLNQKKILIRKKRLLLPTPPLPPLLCFI